MKFFLNCMVCMIISISNALAIKTWEFNKDCGNFNYIIKVDLYGDYWNSEIRHYVSVGKAKKKLFYTSETGKMVDALCIENKKPLLVFSETCLGDDDDCRKIVFGIYDPQQQKMLVSPVKSKNNLKLVKKTLGFVPNYDELYENGFCCSRQMIE